MRLNFTPFIFLFFLFAKPEPYKIEKSFFIPKAPLGTTVEVFQDGCAVPDLDFNLGENICGRISSDIFPQLKFQWVDPGNLTRREGVALVSDPQTDSWTLPATKTTEVSPGLFIDNRGTWKLNAARVVGGVQANLFFRVHDPANPLADLVMNAFAGPDPVNSGSNITYTFHATQNGPDAAQNVVFTATIPQNTSFVSLTAPAGWTVNAPSGGTITATRATWDAFPLNVATSPDEFILVVTAPPGAVNSTQYASIGSIYSSTEDRQLYTNIFSAHVSSAGGVAGPSIIAQSAGLLTESCAPANGTIDPGETVTVTFEVRNVGTQAANNVMGTLLATNNVTSPPGPVSFGNIAPGANVTRDITFIANPAAPCGSGLVPSISFTSDPGATSRGTIVFQRLTMLSNPSGPSNIPACCGVVPACLLTCPSNITVNNTLNQCGAIVSYPAPTTNGSCGTVTSVPASGSFFPVGTTTVNVTTSAGPSCSFTVTVNDIESPSITCPGNITVAAAAGNCNAVVNYPAPTVSDNCPGVSFVAVPASGSTFSLGNTTVTVTATDASGNTSSCTFTVTVTDNQNPVVTCPANITVNSAPGSCVASVVTPAPGNTDNCAVTRRIWTMNGATSGASPLTGIQSVGTQNFNAGVTTITYTVYDAANNSSSCSFTVTVNDVTPPTLTCPKAQQISKNFLVSINKVEEMTGINFFSKFSATQQNNLEAVKAASLW